MSASVIALVSTLRIGVDGPCQPALDWLATLPADTTPEQAWEACPRGAWLVWALGALHCAGHLPRTALVRAAEAAARSVLGSITDGAVRAAATRLLDTVARWRHGTATLDEVRAVRAALYALPWGHDANAANAAANAANAAAYAAAVAASAATAAAYAAAAAAAAANAYAYAYAYAAYDAAYDAAAASAIRAVVPWSVVATALQVAS